MNCRLKCDTFMKMPQKALFTSRSLKSSVGLRPYICRTIEKIFSTWGTTAGDIWKWCGHFLLPAVEFLNFLNFWMQQDATSFPVTSLSWLLHDSDSVMSHDSWLICRDRFPRYFNHQPAKACIFQPSLRTRRCVGFWISSCPRVRFPCRCFEHPRALRRNRMGSRMRNLSRQLMSGSSPSALVLPQSCLRLFVLDASDICFHLSGSLSLDHANPSVAFRSIKFILWSLSMHLIILFLHLRSSSHPYVFPPVHAVTCVLFW